MQLNAANSLSGNDGMYLKSGVLKTSILVPAIVMTNLAVLYLVRPEELYERVVIFGATTLGALLFTEVGCRVSGKISDVMKKCLGRKETVDPAKLDFKILSGLTEEEDFSFLVKEEGYDSSESSKDSSNTSIYPESQHSSPFSSDVEGDPFASEGES